MKPFDQMLEMLFSDSNPGGMFLICLAVGIPTFALREYLETKMLKIALLHDPEFKEDNPFTRILLKNAEVWVDPEWRRLKFGHTIVTYFLFIPFLFGLWFGFNSLIIIVGALLGWWFRW